LIYLDTSAIVPYYVPEKLSAVVEQLLQKQEDKPIISQLVEVELFSALSRRVRMGEVSQMTLDGLQNCLKIILMKICMVLFYWKINITV